MKNDHTYEYRVFTNRLVDVGPMEVGNCTKKVVENLKSKDKVDGRFFHTSDSNEWFFCWDGKLQKLNLSGDASVNEALEEVRELIKKADDAVGLANDAAAAAGKAAEDANAAVESIGELKETVANKADKDDVVAVSKLVETKAEKTVVDGLIQNKADQSAVDELSAKVDVFPLKDENALKNVLDDYATKENIANFITIEDVLSVDGLATTKYVDEKVASIEIPSVEGLATVTYVDGKLNDKQDKIDDIVDIRSGAAAGAVAEANANSYTDSKSAEVFNAAKAHSEKLTNIYDAAGAAITAKNEAISYADAKFQEKGDYALKTEIPSTDILATKQDVADAKDWVSQQGFLTEETLKNSTVISDINSQISDINTLLGDVKSYIKDTILA